MITDEAKSEIEAHWRERPGGTTYPPASVEELADFEATHRPIPEDFRWFLQKCGSGVVGSEWLDGIEDLFASHQKFHEECTMANGWRTKEIFLIGWDGSGAPIGILPNGTIAVEDVGSDRSRVLAPSLGSFLLAGLKGETAETTKG